MLLSFENIHLNAATRMAVIIKADQILLNAIGSNYSVNIKGKRETAKVNRQWAIDKRQEFNLALEPRTSNLELQTSNFELHYSHPNRYQQMFKTKNHILFLIPEMILFLTAAHPTKERKQWVT